LDSQKMWYVEYDTIIVYHTHWYEYSQGKE